MPTVGLRSRIERASMANSIIFQLLSCFLLPRSVFSITPSAPNYFVEECRHLVNQFYSQARTNRTATPESQFAVLMFSDGNTSDTYIQREQDGDGKWYPVRRPSTDNNRQWSPPTADAAINYMVARLDKPEEAIMEQNIISTMWNNYMEYFSATPTDVMLFSWLMPCQQGEGQKCRQLITDAFDRAPLKDVRNRVVAYNRPHGNGEDHENLVNLMKGRNVVVLGPQNVQSPVFARKLSHRSRRSSGGSSKSFQQCLVDCYGVQFLGICTEPHHRLSVSGLFIDQLLSELSNVLGDVNRMKSKAAEWMRRNVNQNCRGLTGLEPKTAQCFDNCYGHYFGRPFNPDLAMNCSSDQMCPGAIVKLIEANVENRWIALCMENAMEGILCSRFKRNSVTVNGVLARNECARHGYSYTWATTPAGEYSWDYCCETPCVSGRCNVGSEGDKFCGTPNLFTVNGRSCRANHPCGLHGASYYWCYVSYDEWDYCCWSSTSTCSLSDNVDKCDVHRADGVQMEKCGGKTSVTVKGTRCRSDFPCSTHDKGYYWCYVDYHGNWEYCCNPYHECGYYNQSYKWCRTNQNADSNSNWQYCS